MNKLRDMTQDELNISWRRGEIGISEYLSELIRRIESAETRNITMLNELDLMWSFDNNQQHTHNWHTKQDFMKKWKLS